MTMKTEIETLERKLKNQEKRHQRELTKVVSEQLAAHESHRNKIYEFNRAKGDWEEEKEKLERSVSTLIGEKDQLDLVLKHIQGDIRVVSEVLYGQDFDPSNIDKLMPMMSNGIEYIPRATVECNVPYIEPIQHLLRIIWRHTYWGLHPFSADDSYQYQTPRRSI